MFETVEACALRCCPPGIRGNEYSAVAQRAAGCNKGPSLIGGFVSTCDAFRRTALPRTTIRPSCRAAGFRCDETAVNSAAQSCRFVAHEDRSITYLVLPSSASAVALHSRFIYHRPMWAARYRSDPVCGPAGFISHRPAAAPVDLSGGRSSRARRQGWVQGSPPEAGGPSAPGSAPLPQQPWIRSVSTRYVTVEGRAGTRRAPDRPAAGTRGI